MMNHVTTPFFARQELRDIGERAELAAIPSDVHEQGVHDTMLALADLQEDAVERDQIETTPGAFPPHCGQHAALESSQWWFDNGVSDGSGVVWFQAAFLRWQGGAEVGLVDDAVGCAGDGPRSTCEGLDGEH